MRSEQDTYLYKAKQLENKEWITGYIYDCTPLYCFKEDYKKMPQEMYILKPGFADWGMPRPMEQYKIDPKTVCRYTGYLDTNNKRIFQNDIIRFSSSTGHIFHEDLIWFNNENLCLTAVPLEEIEYNGFDYYNNKYNKFNYETFCQMLKNLWEDYSKIEVVGNIFDNYDLILKNIKGL